jgi:2'-5' RNA ligase
MSKGATPATACVVAVPEAELLVGTLRFRFDASSALGVPAHITVLHPLMPADQLTPEVLQRAADALVGLAPFDYRLARIGRFDGVLYLAPEPAAPFVALTEALVRAFPAFPPFAGVHDRIVPHLTVAQGDARTLQEADAELRAGLRAHGPVAAHCRELCLLQNTSGRWQPWHRLPLRGPGAPES